MKIRKNEDVFDLILLDEAVISSLNPFFRRMVEVVLIENITWPLINTCFIKTCSKEIK